MKLEMKNEIDEEILLKYLNNLASKEEIDLVEKWYNENDERKKMLEQIYYIHQTTDQLRLIRSLDTEQSLARFKSLVKKKGQKSHTVYTLAKRYSAYAAIFLLAFVASYFLQQKSSNKADLDFIEVKSNAGTISSIILPDKSKVWLNSMTTLRYPSRFDDEKRIVEINGEGYFEVTEDKHKPFVVKSRNNHSIEVLGTSFNINAYEEDNEITTSLLEGSVRVCYYKNEQVTSNVLKPNEQLVYNSTDQTTILLSLNDIEREIVWRKGKIVFKNTPMGKVLKKLERYYNVSFNIKDDKILNSVLTATFQGESLDQTMNYVSRATKISYEINIPEITNDSALEKTIVELFYKK